MGSRLWALGLAFGHTELRASFLSRWSITSIGDLGFFS